MSVTVAQATTLLENTLFESASLAQANASYWASLSTSNSSDASLSGLAQAMAASNEVSITEEVARLYLGAFGRSPSGSEVQYYVNLAEAGLSAAQIAQGSSAVSASTWNNIAGYFTASPEFAATGGSSNEVTLLYVNILGRTPSSTEANYYQSQLNAGYTSANLLQEFINSPEYQSHVNSAIASELSLYGVAVANGVTPPTISTNLIATTSATTIAISGYDSTNIGSVSGSGTTLQIDNDSTASANSIIGTVTNGTLGTLIIQDVEGGGSNGLTITTLNIGAETDLIITNVANGGLTVSTLQSSGALTNLTLSGSAAIDISNITGVTSTTMSLAYTGTSTAMVDVDGGSSFIDASLTTLNLTGNIAFNGASTAATFATTGVSVNAGGDNANIHLNLTGAASGDTDTITLGDGNNSIIDATSAGALKITVGSGANVIQIQNSSGSSGYSAAIQFAAHSSPDIVYTSVTSASATTPGTIITGAQAGDEIIIADGNSVTSLTATQQASVQALSTLALAIAYVDGGTIPIAANSAVLFTYNSNSYIIESHAAGNGTLTASDSLIELVGVHSLSSTVSNHTYILNS